MLVNRPLFLGRQSKPCKELLKIAWVQRATKIPTLQFLAIMAAIMDWFVYVRKASGFRKFGPECYSFIYLFIFCQWSESHHFEGEHARTHSRTPAYDTQSHTHSACPTHQTYTKAMWQHCPCLAPLSCPSHSHRAVTLVSSSCTLLESQHLSGDGLTLLSDIL